MKLRRRVFLTGAAALLAAPAVLGRARPRVVIVGGGPGGASVARHLADESGGAIEVMLIEPARCYHTCFFSNLYLGGFREADSLVHGYGTLAADYGINIVHDWAVAIDRDLGRVSLAGGAAVEYDRLVLAPGIDFVEGSVPGWDLAAEGVMPHAYRGGTQLELLKAQLLAMPEGGVFVMIAPPDPYRCPPGPYERVSMIAYLLRERNPRAKIIIADPKAVFSKMELFQEGWADRYPGMIDWIGPEFGGGEVEVRPEEMIVMIDGEPVKADACNVIPAMQAGRICAAAGLTEGGWAPVVPATLASRMDARIHVLGDSALQGDMPKSAYAANSQARVVAAAIRAELLDAPAGVPEFANTCWSLIDADDAVKVGATYRATDEKIARVSGFISQTGEPGTLRAANYVEALGWYAGIISDSFG